MNMAYGPSTLLCFRGAFLRLGPHSFRVETLLQESSATRPGGARGESVESPQGPGRSKGGNSIGCLVSVCCNRVRVLHQAAPFRLVLNGGESCFDQRLTPSASGCPAGRLWKNKAKVMKAIRNPLRRSKTISTVRQHPFGTFRRSYSFPASTLQSFRPSYEGASFSLGRPVEEHF